MSVTYIRQQGQCPLNVQFQHTEKPQCTFYIRFKSFLSLFTISNNLKQASLSNILPSSSQYIGHKNHEAVQNPDYYLTTTKYELIVHEQHSSIVHRDNTL